ncbi:MAG: Na/Pi cotransporter family protein [Bacteroidales bacterium]|nr:Na/Pi cotransporter family protein [Bacteroidales bacterium]
MIGMQLLGSLGLLIFGMRMMSDALQKMAGSHLRHILSRMTANRFTGMLTGAFVTCAVQSSSATTVMVVSFVSAGLLTLAQSISIIMGANIGTTLTAWIMSLGYSVDLTTVVYPAFAIGILLIYSKRHRYMGDLLYGIAFLFLALVLLSAGGKSLDLEHNESVVQFFASFDTSSHLTIIAFLAIGTVITCVVQSSAAVMAITILLCSTGVLPVYLGIALVMGENIGTTATANFAALGVGIKARQTALAHLLFNVFGVTWVLIVFYPFVDLVCSLAGYDPTAGGQAERLPVVLAMFHSCFNVANTAVLIGFIPQMERVVRWILPDVKKGGPEPYRLMYLQSNLIQTPEIAVLQAQKEAARYADEVCRMFTEVRPILTEMDEKKIQQTYDAIDKAEQQSDEIELEIAHYLEQVSDGHLSDETKTKIRRLMREIGELESIADACFNLARTSQRRHSSSLQLGQEQQSNLVRMADLCNEALAQMSRLMHDETHEVDIKETYRLELAINDMRDRLKSENIRAVNDRVYDYEVGVLYSDLVGEMERLGDYIVNASEARVGKKENY